MMAHFYVTLPSYSSGSLFLANTISDMATTFELEHDKLEVGLVEISYPKGYKKRILHNTLCLGSEKILFTLKI